MKVHMRRVVAFVVGRVVSGKQSNGVFDQAAGKQFNFTGEFAATRLTLRDHNEGCEFKGLGGSGLFTLSHPNNGKPITLKVNGNNFEGFDYDSAKRYRGSVEGNRVSLHDDQVGQQFEFTL